MSTKRKVAVVLFNLGGPDGPEAVQPFLFNLFSDKAIIRLPQPLRWLVATLISSRRAPVAREIYQQIGGRSPILPLTQAQAQAIEAALADEIDARCFIAMRYWHPFAHEAVAAIMQWGAEEIVLLPLYPQYSTTTSESSFQDWDRAVLAAGLALPTTAICCYPAETGFIAAHVELLRNALASFASRENLRVLFSAHGLPENVIKAGDPYQAQVEQTCVAITDALGLGDLDWVTCFQSRVGPMKWIGPSTEDEIKRAGAEGKDLIVVPVAFVSEHSETLVELDIEYAHLARETGVGTYVRVPALGTAPFFIKGLAGLVSQARHEGGMVCPLEAAGQPCTREIKLKSLG